jgi:hypothetical protein
MTRPDWSLTGDTMARLREEISGVDDDTLEDFEAFSRFVSDELREYGIDAAHDEWATYHGLAFMSLIIDLARNNFENDAIDHDTAGAVTAIAKGVALALARHVPEDRVEDHDHE